VQAAGTTPVPQNHRPWGDKEKKAIYQATQGVLLGESLGG